jgi:Polyketide cyclase / dehydrase and lipid transport
VRSARATGTVALAPEAALTLWTNPARWPTFVEGFGQAVEVSPDWPAAGSKAVWQSIPGGRGRVTEKVEENETDRFVTQVFEDALAGRQALRVLEDADGSRVELSLEYQLTGRGPMRAIADVLFIRRALRDALRRTLRRFAVEAEEEASLGE